MVMYQVKDITGIYMTLFCRRLAILGVTSQFANRQVERDKYIEDIGQLQSHVSRLNCRWQHMLFDIYAGIVEMRVFLH